MPATAKPKCPRLRGRSVIAMPIHPSFRFTRLLLLMCALGGASGSPAPVGAVCPASSGLARQIERQLSASPEQGARIEPEGELIALVEATYRARACMALWLIDGHPSPRATVLRNALSNAAEEGLPPERYRTADIARLWHRPDEADRARLDVTLTTALARYLGDITQGRDEFRALEHTAPTGTASAHPLLKTLLEQASETQQLEGFLRELTPDDAEYRQLKAMLHQYRELSDQGGWPAVPPGPTLKPGTSDPRIPVIRRRLTLSGDYSGGDPASTTYDSALGQAVRRFQRRHALPSEGILGAATLSAMNVPAAARIRQIALNMERHRRTPPYARGRHIVVNIPAFELVAFNDLRPELKMPVVVGKAYQQTPVFDDQVEYLEFNPDWLVPPALAADEYLPELRKDPSSLARKHIRIFRGLAREAPEVDPRSVDWNGVTPTTMIRYALRQEPGPWNALGRLKFMLPNPYNVYLHDTSEPRYFAERQRTYSHGCIRLSRPEQLALWVLEGTEPRWNLDRIRSTVDAGQPATVRLAKPIPIRIAYRTVSLGDDPLLQFLPDVYGRDAALERLLLTEGHDLGSPKRSSSAEATPASQRFPSATAQLKPTRGPGGAPDAPSKRGTRLGSPTLR